MNIDLIFDLIGFVGVGCILLAYFWLQNGKLTSHHKHYHLLNIAGSLLMLVSLYWQWNTPSVIIQCSWIAISLYGMVHVRKPKG